MNTEEFLKQCKEMTEPKEGLKELQDMVYKLSDREIVNLFFRLLGAFSSSTHANWKIFRDTISIVLPKE